MCDFNENTNTATFEDSELAALASLFGGIDGVGDNVDMPVADDVDADSDDTDDELSEDELSALNDIFAALFGGVPNASEDSDAADYARV